MIFVVIADVGFRGRRENRFRQLLGLFKTGRQFDAANGPAGLVILPAGADQVAAHDRFDRQRLEPLDDHAAGAKRFAQFFAAYRSRPIPAGRSVR